MDIRIATCGLLVLAGSAALPAGCTTADQRRQAQAAVGGERQCFLASRVNGFRAVDQDTVHVTVGVRDVYELDILATCPRIDWSQRIAFRTTGGGSWVCNGLDAELIVPSTTGVDRCPVLGVRRLSPEEVDALRRGAER